MVPGGGATNHVVPFQIRLLAAHRGVHKGTLIDDSVWPEENDLRRRFLSDEGAAFTLLFRFENRRARERSERARESPLLYWSINPPRLLFSYAKSTISKEKIDRRSLMKKYRVCEQATNGVCYYFIELYKRSQVIMLTS